MISLLGRLFIKNSNDVQSPLVRRAWGTLAAILGIILNLLLFAAKFLIGMLTGALSIQADAVNNLSDAGGSVVSLVSFKLSAKPADREHPFGHARIEYVASLVVSFFILFIGVELVRDAIDKFISPIPLALDWVAITVLSLSILCKLWMAFFNRKVSKRIDSDVMRATAIDSLSDAAATAAVLAANLLGLLLPDAAALYIDPVMSVLVATLIFVAGLRVLLETKNSILGTAPDKEVVTAIRRVVSEYPEALGVHDLIVHNYGPGRTLASLHIEVDGKEDIFRSHDTIDLIERRLAEELHIACTIHMDPIVTDDEEVTKWLAIAKEAVAAVDARIELHDFRIVPGLTHTNLIFDIAVPFEIKTQEHLLKDMIDAKIRAVDPSYFTVITVDRM
ncbi:MAG: cation transporter [Clostridia bacterium]|nr:cation transporter [Clostridia bacterium]